MSGSNAGTSDVYQASSWSEADVGHDPQRDIWLWLGVFLVACAFFALLIYAIWRYTATTTMCPSVLPPPPPPQCTTPDYQIDPANCGFPGLACQSFQICQAGVCVCASPDEAPFMNTCVNVKQDSKNCGAPGIICPANQRCLNGECVCALTVCGIACVDTNWSQENCGSCAHSCGFGKFVAMRPVCRWMNTIVVNVGSCAPVRRPVAKISALT